MKQVTRGPLYKHGVTLIPAGIKESQHYNVGFEIIYPTPNRWESIINSCNTWYHSHITFSGPYGLFGTNIVRPRTGHLMVLHIYQAEKGHEDITRHAVHDMRTIRWITNIFYILTSLTNDKCMSRPGYMHARSIICSGFHWTCGSRTGPVVYPYCMV